jgi:YHS domain-containing protein
MPIDPVCGIELDESLALVHEYKGKKYYFCCHGCKRIFVKKPNKWKKTR